MGLCGSYASGSASSSYALGSASLHERGTAQSCLPNCSLREACSPASSIFSRSQRTCRGGT